MQPYYSAFNLYQPRVRVNAQNPLSFFMANSHIDMADLLHYKQATQTQLQIAINTDGQDYPSMTLADNVIYCSAKDAPMAMQGLQNILTMNSLVNIDFEDIQEAFSLKKAVHFIQAQAEGENNLVQVIDELYLNYAKLLPNKTSKIAVLISVIVDGISDLNALSTLTHKLTNSPSAHNTEVTYYMNFVDEFKYWQGDKQSCWAGIYLTYDEYTTT